MYGNKVCQDLVHRLKVLVDAIAGPCSHTLNMQSSVTILRTSTDVERASFYGLFDKSVYAGDIDKSVLHLQSTLLLSLGLQSATWIERLPGY